MKVLAVAAAVALGGIAAQAAVAAPTRAQFLTKGDAVCAQTKRELAPIRARAQAAKLLPQDEQWAAAASVWADQIVIQKRFVSRFKAIGTPAGDTVARSLVAKLARGVTLGAKVRDSFAARDVAALQTALPAYLRFTLDLNRRVVAYGFRTCGR